MNWIRETNGNFESCKRLGTSRLHDLHESNFPFVSRIEFIRSKLSNLSADVGIQGQRFSGRPPAAADATDGAMRAGPI